MERPFKKNSQPKFPINPFKPLRYIPANVASSTSILMALPGVT